MVPKGDLPSSAAAIGRGPWVQRGPALAGNQSAHLCLTVNLGGYFHSILCLHGQVEGLWAIVDFPPVRTGATQRITAHLSFLAYRVENGRGIVQAEAFAVCSIAWLRG